MNVVNEVRNNKGKCKIDHELQITFCHSAPMLTFRFKSGDASLYPLMLSVTFSLLLQRETMNRSLQTIEYILQLNLDIDEVLLQLTFGANFK
ncbi:hypothetical protein T07_8333 [Trichinella nelsoni]|uniref:Uncharacterized protein n=1 Tax=Trichinella nelsoni TaxID=6336 RepID=A0A0V0SBP8_9BILA|nr:hypothetical protein T07_8333 [Trichinella nelsoni]